jgi:hypothetical protein
MQHANGWHKVATAFKGCSFLLLVISVPWAFITFSVLVLSSLFGLDSNLLQLLSGILGVFFDMMALGVLLLLVESMLTRISSIHERASQRHSTVNAGAEGLTRL